MPLFAFACQRLTFDLLAASTASISTTVEASTFAIRSLGIRKLRATILKDRFLTEVTNKALLMPRLALACQHLAQNFLAATTANFAINYRILRSE